ncbi:G-type lectin S-receptor-like serine/threonine-protein kinase SD2-5 [Morus notabilis]|uniref:G-type lectin S-receptor-like serine/threonine-protein kinase SD2-5 n=1 Tax=Morus notabilis TaxID=981085 RepID=W9RSY5_9ROSA|nr:G-type lectin S-receptor-like serine/threonine-protein kinase SD2-5 [Morus notabilis]
MKHFEATQLMGIGTRMNLTEEGNLVLLNSHGNNIWQSFDNPTDTLLVGRRLHRNQTLSTRSLTAAIMEAANFSVFTNTMDGRCLIYYQFPLDNNSIHSSVLHYVEHYGTGFVVNLGTSQKSHPLEFIEYVKLDLDGRMKTYRYDARVESGAHIVDMDTQECEITSQARTISTRRFTYEKLQIATDNFNVTLGTAGFGTVFKGELTDYTEIAVKQLDEMSRGMKEFLAEVETIGRLHHFNLVSYNGADQGSFSIVAVEKYSGNEDVVWSANGLLNPLQRPNTTMRGTPGYLAPELQHSTVTVKVDVYSFGIVLEIVCKRRNVESSRSVSSFHLLKMLQKRDKEDRLIDIVEDLDEDMQNNEEDVMRTIRIGA